jgi:hypothetical protein
MIIHAYIPADDPERVARVIAEVWLGEYFPSTAIVSTDISDGFVIGTDGRRTDLEAGLIIGDDTHKIIAVKPQKLRLV